MRGPAKRGPSLLPNCFNTISMPVFERGSITINYEVHGSGHPLLLLAPGGMRSVATMWADPAGGPRRPWVHPFEKLSHRFPAPRTDHRTPAPPVAPTTPATRS